MATDKEGQLKRIDYGDRIFFDSVTGIAGVIYPIGTAAMPSSVIANVITLCTALNLSRIDVHGVLQLLAAMQHYTFFGHCHESIADVLDLNGQDVDDSRFDNCLITGAQGGAGLATYERCIIYNMTGFRGMANSCSLYTPLAVSVGVSDLDHCTSLHGVLTVTVGAPARLSFKKFSGGMILTAQTGGVALVRGISGHLEVNLMTGGTLDIHADAADIQINANCDAPSVINIYGNARVTVVGAPTATINDYTIDTSISGKLNVQDVVIYPVAEDVSTDEIADDGTSPPYYPVAAHSTDSNAEVTPGVAWTEDIDFEQEGVVNLISIYAEFEWQTLVVVGGGDATNSLSKIQISRDGGATWVNLTDNFINPAIAMTNRIRAGVGLWIPTIVAGAAQLQFRLVHWTDDSVGGGGRSTSEAQIRSNSYVRITYRKA